MGGGSYLSAEMKSVYSTALADCVKSKMEDSKYDVGFNTMIHI